MVSGCSSSSSSPSDGSSTPNTTTSTAPGNGSTTTVDFVKDVQPVIQEYCVGCHSGGNPAGGVDMSILKTNDDAKANKAMLSKMEIMVEGGKMPPRRGKPLPDDVKTKLIGQLKSLGS